MAASNFSMRFLSWFESNPEKEVQSLIVIVMPSLCKEMADSEQRRKEGLTLLLCLSLEFREVFLLFLLFFAK